MHEIVGNIAEGNVIEENSSDSSDEDDDGEEDAERALLADQWIVSRIQPLADQEDAHIITRSNSESAVEIARIESTYDIQSSPDSENFHDNFSSSSSSSTKELSKSDVSNVNPDSSVAPSFNEDQTTCSTTSASSMNDESMKSSYSELDKEQASVIAHRRQMKAMSLSSLDTDHESDEDIPMQICF